MKSTNENRVLVVCPTSAVEAEFDGFAKRTATTLKTVQEFINQATELNEEAEDFHFQSN
jgi:hypothetical protein